MYFKPYSTFKLQCQTAFTTEDLQRSGIEIGKVSDSYYAMFVSALIAFILLFISTGTYYKMHKYECYVIYGLTLLDILLHIVVFIFIQNLKTTMSTVNVDMFEYLSTNQCTDGALARGIDVVASNFLKDASSVNVAQGIVIASIFATIFAYIGTNFAAKDFFIGLISSKKSNDEEKAYAIREEMIKTSIQ
jgi:hypothetical protein